MELLLEVNSSKVMSEIVTELLLLCLNFKWIPCFGSCLQWENFSLPELNNFMKVLDREEDEAVAQLRYKYRIMKRIIQQQLKEHRKERLAAESADTWQHCSSLITVICYIAIILTLDSAVFCKVEPCKSDHFYLPQHHHSETARC